MTGNPEASLRDELAASFETATTSDAPPPVDGVPAEGADVAPPAASTGPDGQGLAPLPTVADLAPLEAPAMWKAPHRDIFGRFATKGPEYRELLSAWQEQWKESEGHLTRRQQEFADFQRRADPVLQVLQPYEQYWAQQGMSPAQGVTQILSYANALADDPAGTIRQLAEMYGVDLQQMVADAPYVDPQIAALERRLAAFEQDRQTQGQQHQQQLHNRVAQEIQAFQAATDEQGNLKAPHFERVFDRMLGLARGGLAQNIQQAYDMAVSLDPDLQAEIAQKRAADEAAAQAAAARKALEASKTVQGKSTTDGPPPAVSLRDELAQQLGAAGFN